MSLIHGIVGFLFLVPIIIVLVFIGGLSLLDFQVENLYPILGMFALLIIGIFGFNRCFKEIQDFISSYETVEIDELGVTIIKKGLFSMRHKIPAEKIRGISLAPTLSAVSSLGSLLKPSAASGQLWIWTTRKLRFPIRVGSGLSSAEAQQVIQKVYYRYPKFQFHQTIG